MQLEIGFNGPGPEGILSGRTWKSVEKNSAEVLDKMRCKIPLDFQVSDNLLTILAARGITDSKSLELFFYPSVDQLHDPFELREMDLAVERMFKAVRKGERVAVHGDFDVDGITGSALLSELMDALEIDGNKVKPEPAFIPDRATDGYGVSARMVRQWAIKGVTLLITVDTGSSAGEEIDLAQDLGMEVIVLDHHIFQDRPAAVALVNPRRERATGPNDELCGVGVAFKFAQALQQADPTCLPPNFVHGVLDLVALGLVADQMAIVGENRILVKKGLERFNDRELIRPGLSALLGVSGLDRGFPVTTGDFAYQLAPRLNACGRIGRVMSALELLLTWDQANADRLAKEADRTNSRRKEQDQLLKQEAIDMAVPFVKKGDPGLVLASSGWHKGIIGIGAARLVEQYQLPVVLLAIEDESARGSVRSIPQTDVKLILDQCSHLLERYGGHSQAAGLTIPTSKIPEFRETFLAALLAECPSGPVPAGYDMDLNMLEMSTSDVISLVSELEYMEPFGSGNRKPVFLCRGVQLQKPPVYLSGGAHLRFAFRGPENQSGGDVPALSREFVSFGSGDAWRRWLQEADMTHRNLLGCKWDILFELGRSTYRPRGGNYDPVQQLLIDIRPAEES